jgi:hypothetical protein
MRVGAGEGARSVNSWRIKPNRRVVIRVSVDTGEEAAGGAGDPAFEFEVDEGG